MRKNIVHPNIICIYSYFSDSVYFYIILEFVTLGSIDYYIKRHGPISDYTILRRIMRQILDAISYCHQKSIAHHDIKPANILITPPSIVKICDFGLACSQTDSNIVCNNFVGSIPFMPPEVLSMKPHDPFKSDMWSLGITFYYLATGHLPFEGNTPDQIQKKFFGGYQSLPPDVPEDIRTIVHSCIQLDPNKRPSASELLKVLNEEEKIRQSKSSLKNPNRRSLMPPCGIIRPCPSKPGRIQLPSSLPPLKRLPQIKTAY